MIRLFSRPVYLMHQQLAHQKLFISKVTICNQSFRQTHKEKEKIGHAGLWKASENGRITTVFHRPFHTSPNKCIHPIFWLLIKPAGKVASIITGRSLRKWWQALPHAEKSKVKEKLVYHRIKIAALLSLFFGASIANVAAHIQETPVTKRRRYIAFTDDQFMKIARYEFENQYETLKENVIDPNDPKAKRIYNSVVNVAQKIVDNNQHLNLLKQQKWIVILIDSDQANAFVLPTGHIFVFKGILNLTDNEDQLAVVLGHEIAHVILGHGAEKVSVAGLLDMIVILVMAGIWFIMPTDGIAFVTQWFYNKVMTLLLHLPYSRKLEAEADEVGLQLIARACFDVREASAFWQKMKLNEELVANGEIPPPEWTSTHPSSDKRAAILDNLIPQAIDLRKTCRCSRLKLDDPREQFKLLKEIVENRTEPEKPARRTPPPATNTGKPVIVPAKPPIKPAKQWTEPNKPVIDMPRPVSAPNSPAAAAVTAKTS